MRIVLNSATRVAALLLMVSAACSNTPVQPQLVTRDVNAQCALTFSAPPTIPPPPLFTQQDRGSCTFTSLGELAYAGELTIDVTAGTQRGTRTFTAPDGASFRATSEGTSFSRGPGLVGFTATVRVIDGSGRFAGITGELRGEGTANQMTRMTTVTFVGTLTYR